jgi:histidyl-tRNA synthetase
MDATRDAALALTRALRGEFAADGDVESRAVGAQLKAADKSGAAFVVLLGEEEWKRGEVVLKDLANGAQEVLARDRLADALRTRLGDRRGSDR